MPFQMGGQHAEEDVGAHPVLGVVVDGADLDVEGLDAAGSETSARLRSSKMPSCRLPLANRAWIWGARRAVIQPIPRSANSSTRALFSMPRSATRTIRPSSYSPWSLSA